MNYEAMSDKELYEYYLQHDSDDQIQEEIEKIPRFVSYVESRDYTVWRRCFYNRMTTDEFFKAVRKYARENSSTLYDG